MLISLKYSKQIAGVKFRQNSQNPQALIQAKVCLNKVTKMKFSFAVGQLSVVDEKVF